MEKNTLTNSNDKVTVACLELIPEVGKALKELAQACMDKITEAAGMERNIISATEQWMGANYMYSILDNLGLKIDAKNRTYH